MDAGDSRTAKITNYRDGVLIEAGADFPDEHDRFMCVLAAAIGVGLAAGLHFGDIMRDTQRMLVAALEQNAEALDELRRRPGTPMTCAELKVTR